MPRAYLARLDHAEANRCGQRRLSTLNFARRRVPGLHLRLLDIPALIAAHLAGSLSQGEINTENAHSANLSVMSAKILLRINPKVTLCHL
jgi:hypothetical protein